MNRKLITLSRIFNTGVLNFIRNISLAIAAMAVMVVTLTIVLFSIIINATFADTIQQITNRINVSVFLQDTTSENQAQAMVRDIRKQTDVAKVEYLTKEQALQSYIEQ